MIKAILYDLGDIFFEAHYWRKWMWGELVKSGEYNGNFREFYELYEERLKPVYENKKDYWEAYKGFIQSVREENIDEFIEESKKVKLNYEKNRELFPGVFDTLRKIHKLGIKNIVITDSENGEEFVRNNLLRKFKINRFIDKVITSKETGFMKPDSNIFDYALKNFNLVKDEVLFVAHDKDEIDGAKKIGLKIVEYNNYLKVKTKADYKISKFSELLNFV